MKLTELAPELYRVEEKLEADSNFAPAGGQLGDECLRTHHNRVNTLAEAQEIWFLCPACFQKNGGAIGTHMVLVGFSDRGLLPHQSSQSRNGGPSRWHVSGAGFDDLTLSPSIDCGCWHGHVQNGQIVP